MQILASYTGLKSLPPWFQRMKSLRRFSFRNASRRIQLSDWTKAPLPAAL